MMHIAVFDLHLSSIACIEVYAHILVNINADKQPFSMQLIY